MGSLDKETLKILNDLAQLAYETNHDRVRIYPRDIIDDLTLIAPKVVNDWSNWTQLIPSDTITMDYNVGGIMIETWSGQEFFMIQLAKSSTPAVVDYIGEVRFNTPVSDAYVQTYAIIVKTGKIPANSGVWGRVKARSAAGNNVTFSLLIQKWLKMANELDSETAWPW